MSPKEIEELDNKVDVVAEYLHNQEVPYLIIVGIPGTEDYIVKDNLTEDEEHKREVLQDFGEVAQKALANHLDS